MDSASSIVGMFKDFARAVPALLRCLEKSGPRESTLRKVYAMLAGCNLEQGLAARVLASLVRAALVLAALATGLARVAAAA